MTTLTALHRGSRLVCGALLFLAGCLDESRLNSRCEWIGDSPSGQLDMAEARDRRHLANDVRIAGENAVRYRDLVQRSAGFAAAGDRDEECLERLYATIAAEHGTDRAHLDAAAIMRDVSLDILLVYLPVGALLLLVSIRLCRSAFRSVPPAGERWTVVLGVVWMGLLASAAATFIAHMLSWNVDTVRLRDFHLSFRAAYLPIGRHPWTSFLIALAVFAAGCSHELGATRTRRAP